MDEQQMCCCLQNRLKAILKGLSKGGNLCNFNLIFPFSEATTSISTVKRHAWLFLSPRASMPTSGMHSSLDCHLAVGISFNISITKLIIMMIITIILILRTMLISSEIMLSFAENSRFNFTECLFYYAANPSALVPATPHFSNSARLLRLSDSLLFSYIWDPSSPCVSYSSYKLPLVTLPVIRITLCDFLYWLANKVLFGRLLLPEVAISPSAPTECQTVNRFGHITNSVSVEKATLLMFIRIIHQTTKSKASSTVIITVVKTVYISRGTYAQLGKVH